MSNTLKDWVKQQYDRNELEDIVNHGCSAGFNGIIYYSETVELHDGYEDEIWDMLSDAAIDCDKSVMELIASFNGSNDVGSMDHLKNLLVWWAVETIAAELLEEAEE